MIRAVYPGTFDPITNAHLDLIARAQKLFSSVVVAVAKNSKKNPYFPLDQRVDFIKQALKEAPGVEVLGFESLLVDCAADLGAEVIIRGLRAVSDFEFEFQLASMNRKLSPKLETVFLTPSENHAFISSSLVREVALLGGNVRDFVPQHVAEAFKKTKGV